MEKFKSYLLLSCFIGIFLFAIFNPPKPIIIETHIKINFDSTNIIDNSAKLTKADAG